MSWLHKALLVAALLTVWCGFQNCDAVQLRVRGGHYDNHNHRHYEYHSHSHPRYNDEFPHPHNEKWNHPKILNTEEDLPVLPIFPGGHRGGHYGRGSEEALEELLGEAMEGAQSESGDMTDAKHDGEFQQRTNDILREADGFLHETHNQEETISKVRTEKVLEDAESFVHKKLAHEEKRMERHPHQPPPKTMGVLEEAQQYLRHKLAEIEVK